MEPLQSEAEMHPSEAEMFAAYLQKYPYRLKSLSSKIGISFVSKAAKYEAQGEREYWRRFGYGIAGPVCYTFVKWFSDLLDDKYPDVTDIAFTARDGYILKQIYEYLPHKIERRLHYIYAPRSVCKACEETSDYEKYAEYLNSMGIGIGTLAIIDSVTMRFSAQKLICKSTKQPVIGFYWAVLQEALWSGKDLRFYAFQKERYHVISAWNLMEFIMTSPEPPVQALDQGVPLYYPKNEFEATRVEIFKQMSSGILSFANDLIQAKEELPKVSEPFIVDWINSFLSNPNQEDLDAFEQVKFSMKADHSDSIPLMPFTANSYFTPPKMKDRIWTLSRQYPAIYRVLHAGKCLCKKCLKQL